MFNNNNNRLATDLIHCNNNQIRGAGSCRGRVKMSLQFAGTRYSYSSVGTTLPSHLANSYIQFQFSNRSQSQSRVIERRRRRDQQRDPVGGVRTSRGRPTNKCALNSPQSDAINNKLVAGAGRAPCLILMYSFDYTD